MALQFPISASVGQTYQSGSSLIYTYNGKVWQLSSANTGIAALNEYTSSLKQALQITGSNATLLGNLNVQGTQTALNQASLQISDKFIRIASGSLSSAQSNDAGIRIDGANVSMSWDSVNSRINFNIPISASTFYGDGSGLTGISSYTNSDNLAYLNSKGVVSGSLQIISILGSLNTYTGSNDTKWITIQNVTSSLISATASYETRGRGIVSGSSQLTSSYDSRYVISGSITQTTWDNIANKPAGIISGSAQITTFGFVSGSYETTGRGILSGSISYTSLTNIPSAIISSSAQITALGFVSSSTSVPAGTISGSSQLTASFDTRYTLSGSVGGGSIPAGTISGSSQLTASFDGRYVQTGSYNSYTASINSFTSSYNIWTSSIATTGSNSFNGNQTITGSLTVSSIAAISSSIAANASSLTLSSGSNLYIQNAGLAEISGSLRVSGSTILTGSISISSGSITMPNRPAFRVIGTASTDRSSGLILSGSAVSVDYNEGGYFSTANGKFTAPTAGLYNVYFNGRVGSANSAMQVIVYKNTNVVQFMWEAAGNTGATHFGVGGVVKLAANDTLEIKVTVGSIQFDGNDSFGVTYIG